MLSYSRHQFQLNQLLTAAAEMVPFPNEGTTPFPLNSHAAIACN